MDKRLLKGIITMAYILTALWFCFEYIGGTKGMWLFAGAILILFSYRAYESREYILVSMQNAETTIFGKPLEKDYWKGEKVKAKKFKWTFKKSSELEGEE